MSALISTVTMGDFKRLKKMQIASNTSLYLFAFYKCITEKHEC